MLFFTTASYLKKPTREEKVIDQFGRQYFGFMGGVDYQNCSDLSHFRALSKFSLDPPHYGVKSMPGNTLRVRTLVRTRLGETMKRLNYLLPQSSSSKLLKDEPSSSSPAPSSTPSRSSSAQMSFFAASRSYSVFFLCIFCTLSSAIVKSLINSTRNLLRLSEASHLADPATI
jgi:hypothetical protein